jgi:hypothetical protein
MHCIGYAKSVPDEGVFHPRRQPLTRLRYAGTLSHKVIGSG